jgi:preprotein translocase subunit SecD
MRKKLLKMVQEWRIILVLCLLVLGFFWIHPNFDKRGMEVVSVKDPAVEYGISIGDIVTNINGFPINTLLDFNEATSGLNSSEPVLVEFKKETFPYFFTYYDAMYYPYETKNETKIGFSVSSVPDTNIEFGLEIVGGTKVLLKPNKTLTQDEIENVIAILDQRLNIFGLKEIPISYVQDFSGNQYFRLEFAGVGPDQVRELLEREGEFEARIGNLTVFNSNDIVSVCIGGTGCLAQVTPQETSSGEVFWNFNFEVFISQEGAERFANATSDMAVVDCTESGCYLNDTIAFFIDGEQVGSELRISSNLKGKVVTNPSISGARTSQTEAQDEMRTLQALLQSRKMPVNMNIEKTEIISPQLGMEFAQNIFSVFLLAIFGVEVIVFIRYRSLRVSLPIMFITMSEIFITLGVASLIHWTLDLAGIAGLIASVGTGVDDQIVMTDEVLSGKEKGKAVSVKARLKNAFFIIIAAFASTVATMIPLAAAGAGILRGFAVTTIIATSVGIFITRPAYARIIEITTKD